jgi:cell division protein FtsB
LGQKRDGNIEERTTPATGRKPAPPPAFSERMVVWAARAWRPAGSILAVALALLVTWHVISGRHGLSVWNQKRVEDKQLRKEIDSLEQENARLKQRIEKLKSDPHAIEREAREKLHYAKQGEVIYALPPEPAPQNPSAVK